MPAKKISELSNLSVVDNNDYLLVLQQSNDGLGTFETYKSTLLSLFSSSNIQTSIAAVTRVSIGAGNYGILYNNGTGEISVDFEYVATKAYVDSLIATKDNSDEITEGSTNLYFTNARARGAISVSGSLSYNSSTGVISYTAPTLATVATSGSYNDLSGKPALATVATSGSYNDLADLPSIPGSYTLPTATTSVLGGVKVDGTTITINGSGVISGATTYTLPTASTSTLGGVKVDGTTITINGSGVISGSSSYTLPTATTSVLGGVKVDGTTITINGSGVISAAASPTFTTVTTTALNVETLSFTGAGAVTFTINNDLNFNVTGDTYFNSEKVFTLTDFKAVVAASSDFNDFKTRVAALT